MTSTAVGRFVSAMAYSPADAPLANGALVQPTVFERTEWIVGQIEELTIRSVGQMVKLRAARIERNVDYMREASAELALLCAQSQQLADITARVTRAGRR